MIVSFPASEQNGLKSEARTVETTSEQMQKTTFSHNCCSKHKKHDKREPGLFKEEFRYTEMYCLCSKTYCCYDSKSQKYKFISKGLNKRALEDSGDGRLLALHLQKI